MSDLKTHKFFSAIYRQLLLLAFSLLVIFNAHSQSQFEKYYLGYRPNGQTLISETETGNLAVAFSYQNPNSEFGILATVVDDCGEIVWSKSYLKNQGMKLVGSVSQGAFLYLAGGLGTSFTYGDLFVLKLDASNGQVIWSKKFTGSLKAIWYNFSSAKDGVFYLNGNLENGLPNSNVILKLDQNGQQFWAKRYDAGAIWGLGTATSDGGYLNVVGSRVFKVTPLGNVLWNHGYQGLYHAQTPAMETNGGYIISRGYVGAIDRSHVFKVDFQGNLLWSSPTIMHTNTTRSTIANDGSILYTTPYYLAGSIGNGIVKISPSGKLSSTRYLPLQNLQQSGFNPISTQNHPLAMVATARDFFDSKYGFALHKRAEAASASHCPDTAFSPIVDSLNMPVHFRPSPISATQYSFTATNLSESGAAASLSIETHCEIKPPTTEVKLGNDTTLCPNETLVLGKNNPPGLNYLWSTGETSPSIFVEKSGLYWVQISQHCDTIFSSDSILVSYENPGSIDFQVNPEIANTGQEVNFSIPNSSGIGKTVWHFGDGDLDSSANAGHPYLVVGNYEGQLRYQLGNGDCWFEESFEVLVRAPEIHLPDAFTPNGDGRNDVFKITDPNIQDYRLSIFNRFGEKVSEVREGESWDGTFNGQPAAIGVYTYVLEYSIGASEQKNLYGYLSLIR